MHWCERKCKDGTKDEDECDAGATGRGTPGVLILGRSTRNNGEANNHPATCSKKHLPPAPEIVESRACDCKNQSYHGVYRIHEKDEICLNYPNVVQHRGQIVTSDIVPGKLAEPSEDYGKHYSVSSGAGTEQDTDIEVVPDRGDSLYGKGSLYFSYLEIDDWVLMLVKTCTALK